MNYCIGRIGYYAMYLPASNNLIYQVALGLSTYVTRLYSYAFSAFENSIPAVKRDILKHLWRPAYGRALIAIDVFFSFQV